MLPPLLSLHDRSRSGDATAGGFGEAAGRAEPAGRADATDTWLTVMREAQPIVTAIRDPVTRRLPLRDRAPPSDQFDMAFSFRCFQRIRGARRRRDRRPSGAPDH